MRNAETASASDCTQDGFGSQVHASGAIILTDDVGISYYPFKYSLHSLILGCACFQISLLLSTIATTERDSREPFIKTLL